MKTIPLAEESAVRKRSRVVGGSGIATPVVGVDYETTAKGRLRRIRSRQLARVGGFGHNGGSFTESCSTILVCNCTINRALLLFDR